MTSNAIAAASDWARDILGDPAAVIEPVIATAWSAVLRVRSHDSSYYLKQPVLAMMIETEVIRLCRADGFEALPRVVAKNDALPCFLMSDCGDTTLRDSFAGGFDAARMAAGIGVYRQLQRATVASVDEFLAAGVPDWRIDRLPALYAGVAADAGFLAAEGIDAALTGAAQDAAVVVGIRARELAGFGIPQCLTHADLHDNNMVLDTRANAISLIDLGEVAVSHPFLSLSFCLGRTGFRYKLAPDAPARALLGDACFGDWGLPADDLNRAAALADSLAHVYILLGHLLLMRLAGPALADMPRMNGRVKSALENVAKSMQTML